MKRYLLAAAALIGAGLLIPTAASATETKPACGMPTGWYINPDETDRVPTVTAGGLKFEGNDLIHHAATGTVEALTHGTFWASPAPDQPSFFSVEVSGSDGGYATLRWNTVTEQWDMVTGGQIYSNTSPAALVDMPASHKSHNVVSFGVGYTANPPGTVATTVRSVSFGGHTYDLRCRPVIVTHSPRPHPSHSSASPSASASASHSAGPSASATSHSAAAGAGAGSGSAGTGALAVTGPPAYLIVIWALGFLGLGVVALLLVRRRRNRFTA